MMKDSLTQYSYSKSFPQQDKSPSGVLGFYGLIAYDLQRSKDEILPASIHLDIVYLLLLKLYFLDFW